jgi:hypothetical protein
MLRELGAEPVVVDVYDAAALREAVVGFAADAVMHQLTDLPDDQARIPEMGESNVRMRTEGTANLLAAAAAAGASRFVAQSVAWELPGEGAASIAALEASVLAADGVVIRYGQFYGPQTYYEGEPPPPPRIQIDAAALEAPSGVLTVVEEQA